MPSSPSDSLLGDRDGGFAPEGHPQLAQQGQGRVVPAGAGHERDIHPVDLLDLVVVDLREDHLLLDADRVVAPAVETVGREPAEVAHARHRDRDEPVQKLEHPRSVTEQPTGMPSRRLKLAIAFLARVTTGCWPVMAASSATADSSALGFLDASPIPTLSTIFTSFGISWGFVSPNCCASFGRTRCS